jgi:hypothetical protein
MNHFSAMNVNIMHWPQLPPPDRILHLVTERRNTPGNFLKSKSSTLNDCSVDYSMGNESISEKVNKQWAYKLLNFKFFLQILFDFLIFYFHSFLLF